MSSWIKLHRKFQKWGWTSKPEMVSLFVHLLLAANYEDGFYLGTPIKRGQVIFGRNEWSKRLGISEQSLRTCIERLKSTNELIINPTTKFSIITIVKYNDYQFTEEESTSDQPAIITSDQPAINQRSTTPKEYKNLRKEESKGEGSAPPKVKMPFSEIPLDWRQWAMDEKGWDSQTMEIVWEGFREYWQEGRGKTTKRADWTMTFKKWVLKENIKGGNYGNNRQINGTGYSKPTIRSETERLREKYRRDAEREEQDAAGRDDQPDMLLAEDVWQNGGRD